jgi:amino acid transporter
MDTLILILSIIILIYGVYTFIISWFFPKTLLTKYKNEKDKGKKLFPFISRDFLDFAFFFDSSKFSIWFARIWAIIVVGIVLLYLYSEIILVR